MRGATEVKRRKECNDGRNFNPRAHEGRDKERGEYSNKSIDISIHAPMRGATKSSSFTYIPSINFNPRAHEGRDLDGLDVESIDVVFQSTRP